MTIAMIATNKLLSKLNRLYSSLMQVDSVLNETQLHMLLTIMTLRELKIVGATGEASVDMLSLMLV